MRMPIDRMTRVVVSLSVVTLSVLIVSAGWIAAIAFATPPPPCIAAAAPPALPSSQFATPKSVAAAAPAAGATTAEAAVAARNAGPLDKWLSMEPAPLLKDLPPLATSYRPMIREAALRRSLSPALVEAIARVESDFNPNEVSEKGALGLLQVMPATGRRFGVGRERLFDPEANLAAGTAYLAWLLDYYRGDLDLAIAAYNAGEGAVDRYRGIPPYRETQVYVKRVRAALRQIETRLN